MALLKVLGEGESAQGLVWTNGGVGSQSNRAAIGARIKRELAMKDGSRRGVYARVSSGGSLELRA